MAPRQRKPAPSNPRARPSAKPTDKPGSGPSRPRRPASRPPGLATRRRLPQDPHPGVMSHRPRTRTRDVEEAPSTPNLAHGDRRASPSFNRFGLAANATGAVMGTGLPNGRIYAQSWEKRSSSKPRKKK